MDGSESGEQRLALVCLCICPPSPSPQDAPFNGLRSRPLHNVQRHDLHFRGALRLTLQLCFQRCNFVLEVRSLVLGFGLGALRLPQTRVRIVKPFLQLSNLWCFRQRDKDGRGRMEAKETIGTTWSVQEEEEEE